MPSSNRSQSPSYEKGQGSKEEHAEGEHPDDVFGGPEARKKLERKLLLKLDLRMSILIVIYILNYVSRLTAFVLIFDEIYLLN